MDEEIKAQWIRELTDSSHVQGRSGLHYKSSSGGETFCCLGVLCDMAFRAGVIERRLFNGEYIYKDGTGEYDADAPFETACYLPPVVVTWAGLDSHNPRVKVPDRDHRRRALSVLNDDGVSFAEIAGYIAADL